MVRLTINGQHLQVDDGTTLLESAAKAGFRIPTMCYLAGHTPETSCMVCLVKVHGRARLLPACGALAEDGMVVETETQEVKTARRTALELLLGDHVGDCVGPCQSGCPAHLDIPRMLYLISEDRYKEAIRVVKDRIAIPAVLGRICPEVCEKVCRRSAVDQAVSICQLKRIVADVDLASPHMYRPQCLPDSGKRVVVVGAGPTGLAATYYLARLGHRCTILDRSSTPGGAIRTAIPEDRLPRTVLDEEIGAILSIGPKFRGGITLGVDVSLSDLIQEYDAVILAVGEQNSAEVPISELETTERGIKVDRNTLATNVKKVFAAGGAVAPSHLAVHSAAEGRYAARSVSRYLTSEPDVVREKLFSIRMGKMRPAELKLLLESASKDRRVEPSGDGFSQDEAMSEAVRCLHCECSGLAKCALRALAMEYGASPTKFAGERTELVRETSHPLVVYEPGKCIDCGICVRMTEVFEESLGLVFIGRGFRTRPGVPFSEGVAHALTSSTQECVQACPTGALTVRGNDISSLHCDL